MPASSSRTSEEGVGLLILGLVALATGVRYAPWLLGAAALALIIVIATPPAAAGKVALYTLAAAAITAPLAALAITNDYQTTSTVVVQRPAANAHRAGRHHPGGRHRRPAAGGHHPAATQRITIRGGFLAAWDPTRQLIGPFKPAALTRWWTLTASVTLALTFLLTATALAALKALRRRQGVTTDPHHASWARIGDSSRRKPF